jgi:hypothetical protein
MKRFNVDDLDTPHKNLLEAQFKDVSSVAITED